MSSVQSSTFITPPEISVEFLKYLDFVDLTRAKRVSRPVCALCNDTISKKLKSGELIPLSVTHNESRLKKIPKVNPFASSKFTDYTLLFYLRLHYQAFSGMFFSEIRNMCETSAEVEEYLDIWGQSYIDALRESGFQSTTQATRQHPDFQAFIDYQLANWIRQTSVAANKVCMTYLNDLRRGPRTFFWAIQTGLAATVRAVGALTTVKAKILNDYKLTESSAVSTVFYKVIHQGDMKCVQNALSCYAEINQENPIDYYVFSIFNQNPAEDPFARKMSVSMKVAVMQQALVLALQVDNRALSTLLIRDNKVILDAVLLRCTPSNSSWLDEVILEKLQSGNYVLRHSVEKLKRTFAMLGFFPQSLAFLSSVKRETTPEETNSQPRLKRQRTPDVSTM